jgi:hypothetical protein
MLNQRAALVSALMLSTLGLCAGVSPASHQSVLVMPMCSRVNRVSRAAYGSERRTAMVQPRPGAVAVQLGKGTDDDCQTHTLLNGHVFTLLSFPAEAEASVRLMDHMRASYPRRERGDRHHLRGAAQLPLPLQPGQSPHSAPEAPKMHVCMLTALH